MTDREDNRRTNDSLQGSEADAAYGDDSRMFGEGGQAVQRPLRGDKDDAADRDPERDESVAPGEHPDRSRQ